MREPSVLAIVQAGGAGSRMDVLTRERAKPTLPFAGTYQLVDFPLSNLANSRVDDVWLSVQYLGSSLADRVVSGRPWDLDRTRGGLRLLMPEEGNGSAHEDGFSTGNADELYGLRDQVRALDPDLVLVMSADHVYRLDFRDVVDTHLQRGADCTVVTTEVSLEEAAEHAVVEVSEDGTVTGFAYKPDPAEGTTIAAEVFLYSPGVLIETLEQLHRELHGGSAESDDSGESGEEGLGDFGHHLLPRLVAERLVVAHPLPGYWMDLGRPETYLQCHRDVLTDDLGIFDDPDWPILGHQPQRVAARVLDGGEVVDSLLSPGCRVHGRVERSVLGPGVSVAAGAVVRDSVVFSDTVVEADAQVDWAVVDQRCRIDAGARVGSPAAELTGPEQLVLVGADSRVGSGVDVAAGARLEPGTTA